VCFHVLVLGSMDAQSVIDDRRRAVLRAGIQTLLKDVGSSSVMLKKSMMQKGRNVRQSRRRGVLINRRLQVSF